ncbi:hypothetical protein B9Z55_020980 [Caenorhabditis nigoni]|uniref:Peptidase M13 C-terminal domain-containing protein n=1 Tax=Caenorhabditis nigoni TaxID=1611254 RepID=A0A2G5TQ79_9PELO|nr:hypothetical protein B9Z55_020980 [Caenorhabditis nigoni]
MSEKDKSLKLIAIVLLWLVAFYTALLFMRNSEQSVEPSRPTVPSVNHKGVCKSPECITLAQQLHNWRDVSVDPCQDFYKAVCGKYNEHSLYRGAKLSRNTDISKQLLKEFLLKSERSESKSENAMRSYYKKCRAEQVMNKTESGINQMKELWELLPKFGGWPMFNGSWDESKFNLNDMLCGMASYGTTDFGFFELITSNLRKLLIYPPLSVFGKFDNDMKNVFSLLDQLDNNTISSRVQNSTELKNKLQSDAVNVGQLLEHLLGLNLTSDSEVPLVEKQANISIDFERFFKSFIPPIQQEATWEKIKNRTYLISPKYFAGSTRNLETVLQTTKKRTIANFLIMNFLSSQLDNSDPQFGDNECLEKVYKKFPLAVLRVFVRNHYDKENLEVASKLVEDIRKSMIEIFEQSTWLHESTKKNAIVKLEKMEKLVGYSEEFEAPGALDEFYETLDIAESDSYLMARMKVAHHNMKLDMDYIASLLSMKSVVDFAISNASYLASLNRLALNVLFLDDPLFDSTFPTYAKIASIGAIIGHEIGHGFDPTGRFYDENGKIRNWWTPEDSAEYNKRAQCLIDQYNNYDDHSFGKNLNGTTTIDEMVSDAIGYQAALDAYNQVDMSKEPSIFGFEDEQPDKMFFHLAALNWCGPKSHYSLAYQLEQVHPTDNFRVNGPLANMKSFAEAFNCPVGSPMNPKKKCELF